MRTRFTSGHSLSAALAATATLLKKQNPAHPSHADAVKALSIGGLLNPIQLADISLKSMDTIKSNQQRRNDGGAMSAQESKD